MGVPHFSKNEQNTKTGKEISNMPHEDEELLEESGDRKTGPNVFSGMELDMPKDIPGLAGLLTDMLRKSSKPYTVLGIYNTAVFLHSLIIVLWKEETLFDNYLIFNNAHILDDMVNADHKEMLDKLLGEFSGEPVIKGIFGELIHAFIASAAQAMRSVLKNTEE
jgi:hypothetical protein